MQGRDQADQGRAPALTRSTISFLRGDLPVSAAFVRISPPTSPPFFVFFRRFPIPPPPLPLARAATRPPIARPRARASRPRQACAESCYPDPPLASLSSRTSVAIERA